MTPSKDISRLIEIMAALRAPGTGCPWDLEQTFTTIAPYTIEEAYEVADAIARGDLADLKDELGDLLLQVVYHARMGEEAGAFQFGDVVHAITAKMIRRHPHVFGTPDARLRHDETARDAGAVKGVWEKIKAEEKSDRSAQRSQPPSPRLRGEGHGGAVPPARHAGGVLSARREGQPLASGAASPRPAAPASAPHPSPLPASGRGEGMPSLLDDVPVALPALTRAVKLQDKAAGAGFDWPSLAPVFEKLREEMAELEEALADHGSREEGPLTLPSPQGERASRHDLATPDLIRGSKSFGGKGEGDGVVSISETGSKRTKIAEELGDLLFVVANVARHLKLDPEAALRGANQKFIRRFRFIEERLVALGKSPEQSTLAEMDALWDEAKAVERNDRSA